MSRGKLTDVRELVKIRESVPEIEILEQGEPSQRFAELVAAVRAEFIPTAHSVFSN
jgi:hypothetical protein